MIKKYDNFSKLETSGLRVGDRVIIRYKDSKYFMQTGKIISMMMSGVTKGDCTILMDYSKDTPCFFFTNLEKIEQIVEIPSGELLNVTEQDAIDLAITGLLKWNDKLDYYYFKNKDRWQIEDYSI